MGQKTILKLFFEEPNRNLQIREISRITNIPKTSVARYIQGLLKDNLIEKKKGAYVSNETNFFFKLRKRLSFLEELYKSGLIEFLEENLYSGSIILFGSFAKGEYVKGSDIDIFVQAKEKAIDLTKFEKKLKHKISLFFEENFENLSAELFNNIINGVKLSGYIKLK